ncbi:MAG: hypothetical protein GY936_11820 [Ignavibacteriae bacterium]|nr:hypothetical protein [Ignavibacteriota bacterium]
MKPKAMLFIILFTFTFLNILKAQSDEPILYYQMEPLDDSLFVQIQENLFIDPPDPKAEIIVDVRDTKSRTIQVRGLLYPLLALPEEIRARVVTFPFKIDLQDNITYTTVFTNVIDKMKFGKITSPPTKTQISSNMGYTNPYLQLFGGERFGLPIKKDIGISMGLGTPYSGPMESNLVEGNFHILGFRVGMFAVVDAFTEMKESNNHNNLYGAEGLQVGYVFPFGNFLEVSYHKITNELPDHFITSRLEKSANNFGYTPKFMTDSYVNWEFRYPLRVLGSTRGKFYTAKYLNEWHIGFVGRELSLAGSTFDLRFDAMPKSDVRNPQYLIDVTVQRILESWGFSAFSLGPSAIFSKTETGNFGVTSILFNMRIKVGTSL